MAGTSRTRRRAGRGPRRLAGRPAGVRRAPGTLTVQLLGRLLVAGGLPPAAVGDELELVPAIYTETLHLDAGAVPGSPVLESVDGDEFGFVTARGLLAPVPLDPSGGCSCRLDVLDAAGHLLPVNWAAAEVPDDDGPVHLSGVLYLDSVLDEGTEHGEAVALCRRTYRVTAIRRYRPAAPTPVLDGVLHRVPTPTATDRHALYVADLLAVPHRPEDAGR